MLGIWLQDLAVWETILSGDSNDTLEAPHMEGVEPALLPHVGAPHLTAIKDGVESAVLVGTELVDHCQHFILPYQPASSVCLFQPSVKLGVK